MKTYFYSTSPFAFYSKKDGAVMYDRPALTTKKRGAGYTKRRKCKRNGKSSSRR